MKLNEIQELIKFVARSGVNEVEIEDKDFKICIKAPGKQPRASKNAPEQIVVQQPMPVAYPQQPAPAPAAAPPAPAAAAPAEPAPKAEEKNNYVTVTSTMIGTFYRSPGPDKDVFVEVGSEIKPGKTICIIEAMKLFNEIESEISGKIVKVLVDDATPVQFGQDLFLVDPS